MKKSAPFFIIKRPGSFWILYSERLRSFLFCRRRGNLEQTTNQDQKPDKSSRSDKANNIKITEEIKMNKHNIHRARLENIKRTYPPGTRIGLISMSDPYAPVPSGTKGTVSFVDDMGTIHPKWDNGRSLGVIVGEEDDLVVVLHNDVRVLVALRRRIKQYIHINTQYLRKPYIIAVSDRRVPLSHRDTVERVTYILSSKSLREILFQFAAFLVYQQKSYS